MHDIGRRIDPLDLDSNHSDAPLVGGVVEDLTERAVDSLTGSERLVEGHLADDVSQVRLGQLGDGQDEVGDVVEQPLRIGRLEVDDGVDGGGDVVLCDDFLRRHVDHLFTHVDLAQLVDDRDDETQARFDGFLVLAESLDHPPLVRADDLDRSRHVGDREDHQDQQKSPQCSSHVCFFFL